MSLEMHGRLCSVKAQSQVMEAFARIKHHHAWHQVRAVRSTQRTAASDCCQAGEPHRCAASPTSARKTPTPRRLPVAHRATQRDAWMRYEREAVREELGTWAGMLLARARAWRLSAQGGAMRGTVGGCTRILVPALVGQAASAHVSRPRPPGTCPRRLAGCHSPRRRPPAPCR